MVKVKLLGAPFQDCDDDGEIMGAARVASNHILQEHADLWIVHWEIGEKLSSTFFFLALQENIRTVADVQTYDLIEVIAVSYTRAVIA
ncbi:hypothetical protein GN958_ATG20140 [Phytophthora infestans]|uniref:Uncharacterized protein n=1 Tax=Phytophthora infestans TaxID=4787 RepID=A0A8S9TP55_PHYIN|nr:hypothetical protein GN958_ATG20140 [Phytophthora infestans]